VLAAFCPFTAIYVATILTETLTIFFALATCLTATLAFMAARQRNVLLLWAATGFLAGVMVMFRPDSALFALAIGITLVLATLLRSSDVKLSGKREELLYRSARASYLGALFSLAFCVALVPWTIRNYRVFHFFQPLAPVRAEMPGDFVPRGYFTWVRTWIDDTRYLGPALWSLDVSPITIADLPDHAFDSAEEKQRVATLLEKYNRPSRGLEPFGETELEATPDEIEEAAPERQQIESEATRKTEPGKTDEDDEVDASDPTGATSEDTVEQPVEMTADIDAGFGRIAQERIARHPFRYYVWLPLKRARTMWFDTHSQYYPFEGQLLPFSDLDYETNQRYWLPLFAALTGIYTLLGFAGGWFLIETRKPIARQWVLLAFLLIVLMVCFFSALENPEPRYLVVIFPFLSVVGGIGVLRIGTLLANSSKG
jgi:hypothetical protein